MIRQVDVQDREGGSVSSGRLDFFISYTSSDRPWAEWIAWVLEAAGYSVLVQAWDFAPGANFVVEIDRAAKWLVVFDNAPSSAALRGMTPQGRSGHVLITSRQHGGWREIADPVSVGVWSREESLGFLSQRTGDSDAAAANSVAEALGDLPLALEQAAAYVDSTQISLKRYRRRLESYAPALFQRGGPSDYEHTIATTWELAFGQLQQDPGCAALLFCCAFLAPLALDDAISRILSFSLLTAE